MNLRFRKKVEVFEAVRVGAEPPVMPEWWTRAIDKGRLMPMNNGVLVSTPDGLVGAKRGNWIIYEGPHALFCVCSAAVFEKTYEPVGDR